MIRRKLLRKALSVIDKFLGNEPLVTSPDIILKETIHTEPQGLDYEDPSVEEDEFSIPKNIFPYYTIKGIGYKLYLDPILSQMIKVKLGTTVVKLHDKPDKRGRILVYTPNFYLYVPEDELECIGYN